VELPPTNYYRRITILAPLKITAEELLLPPTRYGVATCRALWDKILRARSTVSSIYNMKRYFMAVPTILIKVYKVQKSRFRFFRVQKERTIYVCIFYVTGNSMYKLHMVHPKKWIYKSNSERTIFLTQKILFRWKLTCAHLYMQARTHQASQVCIRWRLAWQISSNEIMIPL
jgi:hypothetical protein